LCCSAKESQLLAKNISLLKNPRRDSNKKRKKNWDFPKKKKKKKDALVWESDIGKVDCKMRSGRVLNLGERVVVSSIHRQRQHEFTRIAWIEMILILLKDN
jgi:hypothetical protein